MDVDEDSSGEAFLFSSLLFSDLVFSDPLILLPYGSTAFLYCDLFVLASKCISDRFSVGLSGFGLTAWSVAVGSWPSWSLAAASSGCCSFCLTAQGAAESA